MFPNFWLPIFSFYSSDSWQYWLFSSLFALFYFVIMFIFSKFKRWELFDFLVITAVVFFLLLTRIYFLEKVSGDYEACLSNWVSSFKKQSFHDFLLVLSSNYNFLYLYVLFLISKIHLADLYLIKIFSIVFDIALSVVVAKIVALSKRNSKWPILAFMLIFGLPTVILNSSYWAQCDVIYVCLAISGLLLFFNKRQKWSMFCVGLSLACKLQAIFFLPIVLVFIIKKDLKLRNVLFLLFGFLLPSIPPLIAGRGVINTFNIYINQMDDYSKMTMNAPTFWSLFNLPENKFNLIAILITAIILVTIFYFIWFRKRGFTKHYFVKLIFLFSLVIPYFLPKMHERYFYMAEIMSVLYFLYFPKKWYFLVLIQWCSCSTYFSYLFDNGLIPLRFGGVIMGLLVFILLKEFILDSLDKRN